MRKQTRTAVVFFMFVFLASCGADKGNNHSHTTSLMERDDTVKNAFINIKTDKPEKTRDTVYENIDRFSATVISENWREESGGRDSGNMNIRVPSSKFLEMVNWFRKEFDVSSMSLTARETEKYDSSNGNIAGGIVYSEIYLDLEKRVGFSDAFMSGVSNAGEALKVSLQTITPVIVFITPYAVIIFLIVFLFRFAKKKIKSSKKGKS